MFWSQSATEEVAERRKSLYAAKKNLELAQAEAAKHANVYAKPGQEKIRIAAQHAQLVSSRRWYNFWEKASRVPNNLQLCDGTQLEWSALVQQALEEVKEAVNAPSSDFDTPFTKSSATLAWHQPTDQKGLPLLRAERTLAATPRLILLSQIRADQAGLVDSSLMYMREHYTYRGGQASIIHSVKRFGSSIGVITLAIKSVENTLPKNIVPGAVRAQRILFGMQIKPQEVEVKSFFGSVSKVPGSQITVVSHMRFAGILPSLLQKLYTIGEITSILNALDGVKDTPATEDLIQRFIDNPDSDDESEAAVAAAAEAEAEVEAEASAAAELGIDVTAEVGPSTLRIELDPQPEDASDDECDAAKKA
eukprot:CAMPEP_0171514122 /NCGR_PEP_ID=MMETSP0959-20130129/2652_1 /TAXON_ID=87120 /ORGANISM="Aurantiochytrium limacinum, Strain ATCCMYA-1381" /LENGTH=363 /DNA_ID=CAMNT_0012052379 /DNA_START=46 /DNA_END=1137 /DNA_ORIENTATION=+